MTAAVSRAMLSSMTAARKLEPREDDPLLRALQAAPMGPPLSAVERAAVEAADRSIASGERGKSQEEIERFIGRMRDAPDDGLDG